ncbi:MAG: SusC/RagA family TonB-linked outer membrane protein [Cyclobacteriaceae bacterium]|nr:SusC/RagA family TonB-linked outer membrane protein [Cyclobacteriaceae bacterium]
MKQFNRLLILLILFWSVDVFSQDLTVKGKVTDPSGEALVGVNVIVKGTNTGVISNIEGNYIIDVPSGSNLLFSFVGYLTKEVIVGAQTTIDVVLEEDVTNLEEVVITGLASSVKRSNLANAVSTISGEELIGKTNPQTLDGAMYGKLAGVTMTSNGGAPGGGINVQLRGISTLGAGSSQPLYIIDGVYVDNSSVRTGRTQVNGASGGQANATQDGSANRIADINPEDIERIEVLKGPSAAAIYGTRANAGVIIITTKKGKAGETKIRFSQDIGMGKAQNLQHFDEWNQGKIEAYFGIEATGIAELAKYNQAVSENRVTDWEQLFYGETAILRNSQLSLSGGSEKTQFYISGGALNEGGIMANTGFERYSLRANVDHKIGKAVSLNFSSNLTKSDNDRGFTGNQNNTGGSIGYALAYTPSYANLFPDEQGTYPNNEYFNDNPIAIRDLGINNVEVNRFINSVGLNVDLYKSDNSILQFSMNGGIDFYSSNSLVYFPEVLQHQQASATPGDVMWGRQDNLNTNIQAFLTYNTTLNNLNLNTQIGMVGLHQRSEFLLTRGRGLSGGQNNLRWSAVQSVQDQTKTTVTDFGIVAQEEFNYEDKIIGTAGVRFDKSTLNYNQGKYYAFPRASLALNLTNFDFWSVSQVSQFKIRTAYGQTGGLPNFGNTFESLTPQLIGGLLGGQVGTRGVDPNLQPETATELEVGFDAAFMDNRFNLEFTYYNKNINDLIWDLIPPESTGILAISKNVGDLSNKGIEIGLGAYSVRNQDLTIFSKLLFWNNKSKITRLDIPVQTVGGFGPSLGTYLFATGYSPTTIVGTPDGTSVPGGFTVYGDRQPDFQSSLFNEVTWKNFSFNFLLHYKKGGNNINLSALLWDDGGTTHNWNGDDDGDGTPNGLDRLLQWAVDGDTGAYIEESGYLKLREIGFYYTLNENILSGMFGGSIDKVKIGVSGNNILISTPYGSYDPEVSNFGSLPIASSIEVTPYPSARRLFFHLNVEF